MKGKPYLSVILPTYDEGEMLLQALSDIREHLDVKGFAYEILLIRDGSPDNENKEFHKDGPPYPENVRVIDNPINRGKGYVVRQGLLEAKGK